MLKMICLNVCLCNSTSILHASVTVFCVHVFHLCEKVSLSFFFASFLVCCSLLCSSNHQIGVTVQKMDKLESVHCKNLLAKARDTFALSPRWLLRLLWAAFLSLFCLFLSLSPFPLSWMSILLQYCSFIHFLIRYVKLCSLLLNERRLPHWMFASECLPVPKCYTTRLHCN